MSEKNEKPASVAGEMATVELHYPLMINGTQVKTLTLRRPKGRDMLVMDGKKGETAKMQALLARLAGLAPDDLLDMDAFDLNRMGMVLANFSEEASQTSGQ
jgi:hypothetical protein